MTFVFLDESGQFKKSTNGQYFIVASFAVKDSRGANKEMKKWFRSKFPKKMKLQNEIKWSQSGISDSLRLKTIERISQLGITVRYGFLRASNIPFDYIKKGKIESGQLYRNIVGEVLEKYVTIDTKDLHIFCDQRNLKGLSKKDFESEISAQLLLKCSRGVHVQVEMVSSDSSFNMQIADWICGALRYYKEGLPNGEKYYEILRSTILSEDEFFC